MFLNVLPYNLLQQCTANALYESKILIAPVLNLYSQRLNGFVYTGLNTQKL